MLTAADFKGFYSILPTPATPNADRWDALDTIDVEETTRLVDALIVDGTAGILALGTTGECATLTLAEYEVAVSTLVEATAGRVPLFIGATDQGTHAVIDRLRIVADSGADGTLLGLPMWQPLTTSMAVKYFSDVSTALPDLAVMAYANSRAFRYAFPVEFWEGVAQNAPTVVAAKVSGIDGLEENVAASGGRIHFLPNEMRVAQFHSLRPQETTACWATAASMGPRPIRSLMEAIAANDTAEIEKWNAQISWANEPVVPIIINSDVFASYNIQLEKVRMAEAGYCRPGPVRPPYADFPEEYAEAARECGRRWQEICES